MELGNIDQRLQRALEAEQNMRREAEARGQAGHTLKHHCRYLKHLTTPRLFAMAKGEGELLHGLPEYVSAFRSVEDTSASSA